MGASCLSSASILRCQSLSKTQYLALIIPTGLELIFSASLVVTNRRSGRSHLLLVAEGWSFLALTLLDILSHLLPAARNSVTVFKTLDIVIGSLSFIPIFLYTSFLFLVSRREFIIHLPERFQKVSKYMLLLFIPAIIALNEIASFVGVSHGMVQMGSSVVIAVGFKKPKDETLFSFFTSLTLALLTAYQGIIFFLACYRVMKALVDQRRIETSSSDENHMFKGTAWVAGGLLLGAIETVIGFAQDGFGGALTRRILRLLARACLIIGLVKGMDTLEDFGRFLRQDMETIAHRGRRRSALRPFISNPRLSTFRRMSPSDTAFRARQDPAMLQVPGQRVTVHYAPGQAPTLEVRFSGLELPSPTALVHDIKSRPAKEWLKRPCSYVVSLPAVGPPKQMRPLTIASKEQPKIHKAFVSNATPADSMSLPPSDWQDPRLPAGLVRQTSANSDSSTSSYVRRTRPPSGSSINTQDLFSRSITPPAALKRILDREVLHGSVVVQSPTEDPLAHDDFPPVPAGTLRNSRTARWVAAALLPTDDTQSSRSKHVSTASLDSGPADPPEGTRADLGAPSDAHAHPWTARPASSDDERVTIHRAVSQKAQLARIKSIGSAPRRATPTPTPAENARDSIPVEKMVLPQESPVADAGEVSRDRAAYMDNGLTRPRDDAVSARDPGEPDGEDEYTGKSFFL